jgi:ABC-2 type transport system permease protein
LHGAGALTIDFGEKFPLSSAGRAVVGYVMERDLARAAAPAHTLVVRNKSSDNAPDAARLARLAAMAMLWLTLTGSLGMLLQAVVRERANRALESLLASAQSWEIVTGKLLGVGAVSFLILASWLGSTAAYSYLLPQGANAVSAVLAALSSPASLLRNALIYLCAFAFYGTATVALGALARDSAAAQNLARPLFMLLLAGFFVAVGTLGGTHGVSWLGYLPPFTPFLLLVSSPGAVSISAQVLLLGMTLAASLLMTWLAARLLSVSPPTDYIFGRLRSKTQLMV